MSTANLNVWITRFGDACHIEDKETWFVHVTDCEGRVLEWCGKKYSFIPAKCGHATIDIPPGCYTVFASHTPPTQVSVPPFGNRLTHVQVVRANCGDHICVTLFSPSLSNCGTWFANALQTHLGVFEAARINVNQARQALTTLQAFLDGLPQEQKDAYTTNTHRALAEGPR
jgi:hypothetical protein